MYVNVAVLKQTQPDERRDGSHGSGSLLDGSSLASGCIGWPERARRCYHLARAALAAIGCRHIRKSRGQDPHNW